MLSAEQKLQEMQIQRQKNEDFFKKHEPTIYEHIKGKHLSDSELKIVKKENNQFELDIIEKGKKRYFDEGIRYCEAECAKFISQMAPGYKLPPFSSMNEDTFRFNRLGSLAFKSLVKDLRNIINPDEQISLPDFYPLLVITGIGLGLHIEKILEEKEISSLIIFEHKLDRVITSLYTLDWEKIYSKFDIKNGKSIQLIFTTGDDFLIHQGSLWNELINYCPHFPFSTLFYNHLSDPINTKVIQRIQRDTITYLQQWGNYDDEINQYNNARHNLLMGAKIYKPSLFKVNPNIPIAVIGAGPSLDEKIDIIKKYQDSLLIISCGTTIGTLAKHNIKPNFHIELESDYIVYEAISKSTTQKYRDGITLLASAQTNPHCLSLFQKSCIYFKDSTSLSELFIDNDIDIIKGTTPTCTNAGVALAYQMQPKSLFLFGTDFGFIDKNKHHASGSIYYQDKEEISFFLANANDFDKEPLMKTTSVKGTQIDTKPMYFTAQRRIEELIKFSHKAGIKVYNCSDGASIKNSNWIPTNTLESMLEQYDCHGLPKKIENEIFELCRGVATKSINEKSEYLIDTIDNIFKTLLSVNLKSEKLIDISQYIFILNNYMSRQVKIKYGYIHYFLRGQLWIFLTMMFTYSSHAKTDEERKKVSKACVNWLANHHESIIKELKYILFHNKKIKDDEWINKTVEEEI